MYLSDRCIQAKGWASEPKSRPGAQGSRATELIDGSRAPGSPCDEILHPAGKGGGRVVDRQRFADDGELEHPLAPLVQWENEALKSDTSRPSIPIPAEMSQLLAEAVPLGNGIQIVSDL